MNLSNQLQRLKVNDCQYDDYSLNNEDTDTQHNEPARGSQCSVDEVLEVFFSTIREASVDVRGESDGCHGETNEDHCENLYRYTNYSSSTVETILPTLTIVPTRRAVQNEPQETSYFLPIREARF